MYVSAYVACALACVCVPYGSRDCAGIDVSSFQSHLSRPSWIGVQGCHGLYKLQGFRVNPKPSTLNRVSILHVSLSMTERNGGIQ